MKAYILSMMMLAVTSVWCIMCCERTQPGSSLPYGNKEFGFIEEEVLQSLNVSKPKPSRSCCVCGLVMYAVRKMLNSRGQTTLLYSLLSKGRRAN